MSNPFLPSRSFLGEAVAVAIEFIAIAAFVAGVWAVALALRGV